MISARPLTPATMALLACSSLAAAQRPTPPTRDPHTPDYVTATELPDGVVPSPDANGNFIIGPTHERAPEMIVKDDVPHGTVHLFTMSSAGSRIYPGTDYYLRSALDAGKVMTACIDDCADVSQLARNVFDRMRGSGIRNVHSLAVSEQQLGDRRAALAKTENCNFAFLVHSGCHLSFSVLSAKNAQRIPRIQNRTTTWLSSQPPFSK